MTSVTANDQLIDACIVGHQTGGTKAVASGGDVASRSPKWGATGFHGAARGGYLALAKQRGPGDRA